MLDLAVLGITRVPMMSKFNIGCWRVGNDVFIFCDIYANNYYRYEVFIKNSYKFFNVKAKRFNNFVSALVYARSID